MKKRINTNQKGARYEMDCKRYLISIGYKVERAPGGRRGHDLYGVFDLDGRPRRGKSWLIQCTASQNVAPRKRKVEEIDFDQEHNITDVWQKWKGKHIRHRWDGKMWEKKIWLMMQGVLA